MQHTQPPLNSRPAQDKERESVLRQFEAWLETPMQILALLWLVLLIVELTSGLSALLETTVTVIWVIFIVEFVIKLVLAPYRLTYIKHNWLTLISLIAPALRLFRVLRVVRLARMARSVNLVRVVASVNRSMRVVKVYMRRRKFGYMMTLTLIVVFAGAAGIYAFEANPGGRGINDYTSALWWTAMMITTMGSDYWPQSAEGRLLSFMLALYAFTVFGYVTAALASFFIGRDVEVNEKATQKSSPLQELQAEIAALRTEIQRLTRHADQ